MKLCGNCGHDISDRAPQARFCDDATCQRERGRAHGRESYDRNRADIRKQQNAAHRARVATRPPKIRLCRYCGKDISHRGLRATWCDSSCRERARHASRRAHRFNIYAHRVQRDCGFVPDPPIPETAWAQILGDGTGQCGYCNDIGELEPDHVIPLSRGGKHHPDNIIACCLVCNRSKGAKMPGEWKPPAPANV